MDTELDREYVQRTDSQVKAGDRFGDPSFFKTDAIDTQSGCAPYCFRLKIDHEEGALAAVAAYKPWWADLKQTWQKSTGDARTRFKNWTISRETKKEGEATHVAMNSGRLIIQFGPEEDTFLEDYAKCLAAGQKMYFVEQLRYQWSPPCFRLFMDLDFKQLEPITERGIEAASSVCASAVARFFSHKSHTIVASTTYKDCTAKDSSGNKIKLVKTGVHLYWPKHYVTPLQCLHIRESIIADLIEVFGNRVEPEMNTWEDVVDQSVYGKANGGGGSGLRMIGSFKTEQCDCKTGKDRITGGPCGLCKGQKRFDDRDNAGRPGRPYMLLCVLSEPDADLKVNRRDVEQEKAYMNSTFALVRDTKLRTSLTEDNLNNGFKLPPGAPIYVVESKGRRKSTVRNERAVEPTDPIYIALQECIRSSFGQLYNGVVVRKVTKASQGRHFTILITGQNCRYCQNIGREHNSQNIYFVASKEFGLVQRCFDSGEKTAEMQYGLCREYSSASMVVSPSVSALLWPETVTFNEPDLGPSDGKPNESFLLKALINNIDFHCKELYPESPSWPSVARLRRTGRGRSTDFVVQGSKDLGTRGPVAYKNIGMQWSQSLLDLIASKCQTVDDQPKEVTKSIRHFEKMVFEAFTTIVTLASAADDPSAFDKCTSMDDFLKLDDFVEICDTSVKSVYI